MVPPTYFQQLRTRMDYQRKAKPKSHINVCGHPSGHRCGEEDAEIQVNDQRPVEQGGSRVQQDDYCKEPPHRWPAQETLVQLVS